MFSTLGICRGSPVSPVSWPALCRRVSFGRARCCFSSQTRQPDLPSNIEEMNSAAQSQFSPTRERETSMQRLEGEATHDHESRADEHVIQYDRSGPLHLNSAMQTNVPDPFRPSADQPGTTDSTDLNMPGGGFSKTAKFEAAGRTAVHPMRQELPYENHHTDNKYLQIRGICTTPCLRSTVPVRDSLRPPPPACSRLHDHLNVVEKSTANVTTQMRHLFQEYGTVAVVFHFFESVVSITLLYLALTVLSNIGVDVAEWLTKLNLPFEKEFVKKAGKLAIALLLNKLLLPVRLAITIAVVPILVRKLRSIRANKNRKL